MHILYPQEHFNCFNYDNGENSAIKYVEKRKGESVNRTPVHHEILFIMEGALRYSYGKLTDQYIDEGHIMLFPSKNEYKVDIEEDSRVMIARIMGKMDFCDHFSIESLCVEKENNKFKNKNHYLNINERMADYLELLKACTEDGLRCGYYFDLKQRELFYLFRSYYPKEELLSFFYPILNNDIHFSDLVYLNLDRAKTVNELAGFLNYSLSGFKKKFKNVFGISAYQWMNREKARKIYHEINCSRKTFTEIAFEYGFYSPSHFNNFCKKNFGTSPGNIRKGENVSFVNI